MKLADPDATDSLQAGKAEAAVLECEASGSEKDMQWEWLWNGIPLRLTSSREEDDSRPSFAVDGPLLRISQPSVADNGLYACVADNTGGVSKHSTPFHLAIPQDGLPTLSAVPPDVLAKLGSSQRLTCDWKGAGRIGWKKPREVGEIGSSGRVRVVEGELVIDAVENEDKGWYQCIAEATGSGKLPPQVAAVKLTIAELGQFDQATSFEPVQNLYAVGMGKRVEVACVPPSGWPTPQSWWSRDGTRVAAEGRVRAEGLQLVLDSARVDDAGAYQCHTENLAGRRTVALELHVSKPPSITRHPSSQDLREGAKAVFHCGFKGSLFPVTRIKWDHDGETVAPTTSADRARIKLGQDGTLSIDKLQLDDEGTYTCVVMTADQDEVRSRPAELQIRENLKWDPRPPINQRLHEGQNAQIQCKAKGDKKPVVRWLKVASHDMEGKEVATFSPPTNEFPPNIRDKNGTLYIRAVRFEDAGRYLCVAASPQGVINKTMTVEVSVPPQFYLSPANRTVWEGADVWLHCGARGTPTPKLDWFHEKRQMDSWPFSNYQASIPLSFLPHFAFSHPSFGAEIRE